MPEITYNRRLWVVVFLALSVHHGIAQALREPLLVVTCRTLNQTATSLAADGRLEEAEMALSPFLVSTASPAEHLCAGVSLNNVAVLQLNSGQIGLATVFAERSVRVLEKDRPPDDPALFGPLHVLASARLDLGEIGKARIAFRRMQTIRIEQAEDRALLHGMWAIFLQTDGKDRDAESELLIALRAWGEAGRGDRADAGSVLNALGSLYIREHRFDDARRVLDEAVRIFTSAEDAVPFDRFKLLQVRAALHGGRKEWRAAEQDLCAALSMTDRLPGLHPVVLERVLSDYARVLRKDHRAREARSVERHAATLHGRPVAELVVDISELLAQSKHSSK